MSRRLVLHIGMPKCGSTSIQQFLLSAKSELTQRKIFVPEIFNFDNSWRLSAASLKAEETRYFRHTLKVFSINEFDDVKNSLIEDIHNLKMALRDEATYTVVVSSEYLYSKVLNEDSIRALNKYLDGWFDEVEIVMVVKRPFVIIKSMYAQYIQGPSMGYLGFKDYLKKNTDCPIYDFCKQTDLWTSIFKNSYLKVIDLDKLSPNQKLTTIFSEFLFRKKNVNLNEYPETFTNKSLGYDNLMLLAKFNLLKSKITILNNLDFNNLFVRAIRVFIRYLPLKRTFPREADNHALNQNYKTFSKRYSRDDKPKC